MRRRDLQAQGYTIRALERFKEPEFSEAFAQMHARTTSMIDFSRVDRRRPQQPYQNQNWIRIGCFRGEQLVGWTYGWQNGRSEFYMASSAVFDAHRRRGIYTAMVDTLRETLRDCDYQKVTSRHLASNRAVIIAKLKMGFDITGFQVSEGLGILVQMTLFLSEARKDLYDIRVGAKIPPAYQEHFVTPER